MGVAVTEGGKVGREGRDEERGREDRVGVLLTTGGLTVVLGIIRCTKAVKHAARLFRSILEKEAVRKIFTSIYQLTSLFPSSYITPRKYVHAHTYTHVTRTFSLSRTHEYERSRTELALTGNRYRILSI